MFKAIYYIISQYDRLKYFYMFKKTKKAHLVDVSIYLETLPIFIFKINLKTLLPDPNIK